MINKKYNQLVQDHFFYPQNVGSWQAASENVLTGKAGVYGVSDVVQIQCVYTSKAVISDACFKVYGNPFTIAAASYATTQLIGKKITEINALNHQFFIDALAMPQIKWHCAILIEDAISAILKTYKQREVEKAYV